MAILGIVMVPFYIHFIGIESYGLIGIYTTLNALASLLDMGISTTMNREMARRSGNPNLEADARNLVRTLEIIYWLIAGFIGIGIWFLAPFLARHWITTVNLSEKTVLQSLLLIGVVMVFQWPFSFYSGGLLGLQKQVLLGVLNAGMLTLRSVGAVLILWLVSPTIQAFLIWQAFISLSCTILVMYFLWKYLPRSESRAVFQKAQLLGVWRFSAGISLIGILGVALTQVDKIVLSKVITLENFGYFTIAGTASTSLYMLITPIYNAIFPQMTKLLSAGDADGLKGFYHQSTEVMAVLLLPLVVVLALFSYQLMFIWQGSPTIATNTYQIVTLLAIGTGLHGLAHIPWALQMSYGWTRLGFYLNLGEVIILVPLLIILASAFGAIGAASIWMVINIAGLLISSYFTHRRFLNGELRKWYMVLGKPLIAALAVAIIGKILIPNGQTKFMLLLFIMMITILSFAAAIIVTTGVRIQLLQYARHHIHRET
jgi:O-antigen/teichoic acid export membrane protein